MVPRFAISIFIARYERYIPVRQVVGTRTARYRAVPPKIDRRQSISVVGGRLKGEIDRRRSIEGEIDRRRSIEREKGRKKKKRKKKKKKEKRRKKTYRPRAVLTRAPSPPASHGRSFSRAGRKIEATHEDKADLKWAGLFGP
ncbi:hypothetical protein GW17_00054993 [Ensete ventricosum]|nr:hypothetical protein GW17_00054993 [Ensete ventricosum]